MRSRLPLLVLLLCVASPEWGRGQTSNVLLLPWSQWSVHPGDDPRCAAIADPACTWQNPNAREPPSQIDIWQRAEIKLPEALRSPQQLGLLIQGAWPVYEVFVNGQRIGGSGSFATRRGPQDARSVFPFSSNIAIDGNLVIALHALNLRTNLEPNVFTPALGPVARIDAIKDLDTLGHLHAKWQFYLCYFLIFCIGLVFLVLFVLDRQSKEYLWLGLNLCLIGCLTVGQFASAVDLGMSFTAAAALYISFNSMIAVTIIEFTYTLMRRPVPLFFRLVEIGGLLFGLQLLLLLPLPEWAFLRLAASSAYFNYGYRSVLALAAFARVVPLPSCIRSPLAEMRWIGVALLLIGCEAESRHLTSIGLPGFPRAIQAGAVQLDLLSLSYLVFAIVMLAGMSVRFRSIKRRNQTIEQELAAASAVQHLLLSSASSSTLAFAIETVYLPAGEVGGDFFHMLPGTGDDGALLIVVGDVSGKGLQAAMTVSTIVGALRGCVDRRPGEVLAYLNRVLNGQITGFVTCCAARIETTGAVTLANAGNPAPYCNGEELTTLPGLPLGMVDGITYDETEHWLGPHDRLTFASDGVIEATSAAGELFGFARTLAISNEKASKIAEAARNFGQRDDITVLTVTRAELEVQKAA